MTSSIKLTATPDRYNALNGIRGLAALSIFLSHAFGILRPGNIFDKLKQTPVHIIWDGAAAVDMFFCLSGFVLTVGYFSKTQRLFDSKSFYIRRIFRLYPPYIISLIIAIILRYTLFQPNGLNGLSHWIASKWVYEVTYTDFVCHAFLLISNSNINSVMWAMIILIRVSLLFPLIILLLKRINSTTGIILLVSGSYLLAVMGQFSGRLFDNNIINNIMKTFTFVPLFLGGALLAKYRIKIISLLNGLASPISFLLLTIGLLIYNIRFYSIPMSPLDTYIKNAGHNILVDSLSGAGCLIIILCVLTSSHLSRLLSFNILSYFGNISFSIYLIHLPVLLVISSIVFPYTNSIMLALVSSFFITLISSHFFYKYIELPFQNIGRNLSNLVEKKSCIG